MSNTACLTSLPFSIIGDVAYATNTIDLHFAFDGPADQATVLGYEWYIDELLIVDQRGPDLDIDIACGEHAISGRLLTAEGWSGRKSLNVRTCVTSPSTLNYSLAQQALPHVDINLQIKDQGNVVVNEVADASGTLQIGTGHLFSIEAYCEIDPLAEVPNAFIHLKVFKNGQVVFDQYIPATSYLEPPHTTLLFSDTAGLADTYEVAAFSVSDALVRYKLEERTNPYVDANLNIRVNNGSVVRLTGNTEGHFYAPYGANIEFIAFGELAPAPGLQDPQIYLRVKLNDVMVYQNAAPATATQSFGYPTTVNRGVYDVWVASLVANQ